MQPRIPTPTIPCGLVIEPTQPPFIIPGHMGIVAFPLPPPPPPLIQPVPQMETPQLLVIDQPNPVLPFLHNPNTRLQPNFQVNPYGEPESILPGKNFSPASCPGGMCALPPRPPSAGIPRPQKFETPPYPFETESESKLIVDQIAKLYVLVKSLDRNQDGSITEDDFVKVCQDYSPGLLTEALSKLLFRRLVDRDKDGRFTLNDVLLILRQMEKRGRKMRMARSRSSSRRRRKTAPVVQQSEMF